MFVLNEFLTNVYMAFATKQVVSRSKDTENWPNVTAGLK
jgi:hypothetical protein